MSIVSKTMNHANEFLIGEAFLTLSLTNKNDSDYKLIKSVIYRALKPKSCMKLFDQFIETQ